MTNVRPTTDQAMVFNPMHLPGYAEEHQYEFDGAGEHELYALASGSKGDLSERVVDLTDQPLYEVASGTQGSNLYLAPVPVEEDEEGFYDAIGGVTPGVGETTVDGENFYLVPSNGDNENTYSAIGDNTAGVSETTDGENFYLDPVPYGEIQGFQIDFPTENEEGFYGPLSEPSGNLKEEGGWNPWKKRTVMLVATIATASIIALSVVLSSSSEPSNDDDSDECKRDLFLSAFQNLTNVVADLSCVNPSSVNEVALPVEGDTFCSTAGAVTVVVMNILTAAGIPFAAHERRLQAVDTSPIAYLTQEQTDDVLAEISRVEADMYGFCPLEPDTDTSSSTQTSSSSQSTSSSSGTSSSSSSTSSSSRRSTSSSGVVSSSSSGRSTTNALPVSSSAQSITTMSPTAARPTMSPTAQPTTPLVFTLTQITTPAGEWTAIASSASGQYIAVHRLGGGGGIFIFTNNGASHSEVSSLPFSIWSDVSSDSSGQYLAACGRTLLYTSSDYGDTWSRASVPSRTWKSITSSTSGQYLTACESSVGSIFVSSNYGASWTQTSAPQRPYNSIASSASGQYLFVAQNAGNPYISSDYGQSWTLASLTPGGRWDAVACSSSGQYFAAAQDQGNLYISSDYGITWILHSIPSGEYTSLVISDSGQYIAAAQNAGTLYVSSDYGVSWGQSFSQSTWHDVTFATNGTQLIAAGNTGIWTS